MSNSLSILCVHGIGHGDVDPVLAPSWSEAIAADLQTSNPELEVNFKFFRYDDLFEKADLNPLTYAAAMGKLLSSGVVHGVGDLFSRSRGL